MSDVQIREFIIRANYPNIKLLKQSVMRRLHNKILSDLEGYLPPVVEYCLEQETKPQEIKVRFEDLYFLEVKDTVAAKKYLTLILKARNGDFSARKLLKKKSTDLLKSKDDIFDPVTFFEDDYMIPSISDKSYPQELISHKGVQLLELFQTGYPVPDFCILTSKTYDMKVEDWKKYLKVAIETLELMTQQKFGSAKNPLIIALRSAMPQYIPGVMPTYLNVGVTEPVHKALRDYYGKEMADRIYLHNLRTIYILLFSDQDNIDYKSLVSNVPNSIKTLFRKIKEVDEKLLTDPYYQLEFLINSAFQYFKKNQDLLLTFVGNKNYFPTLILQKMVWTIREDNSYPGVLFSRHSRTGLGVQIESVRNIFGEDIMTGMTDTEDFEYFDRSEIRYKYPEVYHFHPLLDRLEMKLKSPVTIEFAAETGKRIHYFAVLQLNVAELTGRAILLSTIDLNQKKIINKKRVLELIHPYHLMQIFSNRIDDKSFHELIFFSKGVSILPRTAVSAKAYFSANSALEAKKRGERVCFCKNNFAPADTIVLGEVDAIVSLTPAAIHVVTACRGYGIPAFLNLEDYDITMSENRLTNSKGLEIREGDWITLSSKRQMIFLGMAKYTPARFKMYLSGEKFKLEPKEATVFVNLARAYSEYQKLIYSIKLEEIEELDDLIRLIQTDLRDSPQRAQSFVNTWFDKNVVKYIDQILQSELGTHQNRHRLYKMLSLKRKIAFFKKIIPYCQQENLKGFTAGSFMLGRFICISHPIRFWRSFNPDEVVYLLNEFILFEKYLQVLNDIGERKINRARNTILDTGLGSIRVKSSDARIFVTLKISVDDWSAILGSLKETHDPETISLIELLQKPYNILYNYDQSWSIGELEEICNKEKINLPEPDSV
jgi:hypothetical protein